MDSKRVKNAAVAYTVAQPLLLLLVWYGLLDCGLGRAILPGLGQEAMVCLGLAVLLMAAAGGMVGFYRLSRHLAGREFWLANGVGLGLAYAAAEGCRRLLSLNLASLGGQNEMLPDSQLVVSLWLIFLLVQLVIRIAFNK